MDLHLEPSLEALPILARLLDEATAANPDCRITRTGKPLEMEFVGSSTETELMGMRVRLRLAVISWGFGTEIDREGDSYRCVYFFGGIPSVDEGDPELRQAVMHNGHACGVFYPNPIDDQLARLHPEEKLALEGFESLLG